MQNFGLGSLTDDEGGNSCKIQVAALGNVVRKNGLVQQGPWGAWNLSRRWPHLRTHTVSPAG